MKKILSIIISIILAFSSVTVTAEAENEYECSEWAVESIERALNIGLLDSETTYHYTSEISRFEFCELIFKFVILTPFFSEWYEENGNNGDESTFFEEQFFNDTTDSRVNFLHHIGIIYGKSETEFAPDENLTREEAATIIVRMIDTVSPMEATEMWYEYDDIENVSDWALNSVQKISNLGFMKGVGNNKFAPADTYTTEQAVATLVRVFDENIFKWLTEFMMQEAGELGYVYENGTWNYVTYDFAAGRRVTPIDVDKDEFRLLDYENFARDNNSVYFMGRKIADADPDTFEVISTADRRHYAKDKNFVYIYVRDGGGVFKVIGADPDTFEVLEFPYAKDKNDAYNGCLPLFVDDVTKFEVIEGGGMSRTSPVETFLGTTINSEEIAKYNNEKYGFVDSTVLYSDEGKAKTEKLFYEGYRLVEDHDTNKIIITIYPVGTTAETYYFALNDDELSVQYGTRNDEIITNTSFMKNVKSYETKYLSSSEAKSIIDILDKLYTNNIDIEPRIGKDTWEIQIYYKGAVITQNCSFPDYAEINLLIEELKSISPIELDLHGWA